MIELLTIYIWFAIKFIKIKSIEILFEISHVPWSRGWPFLEIL